MEKNPDIARTYAECTWLGLTTHEFKYVIHCLLYSEYVAYNLCN